MPDVMLKMLHRKFVNSSGNRTKRSGRFIRSIRSKRSCRFLGLERLGGSNVLEVQKVKETKMSTKSEILGWSTRVFLVFSVYKSKRVSNEYWILKLPSPCRRATN